MQHALTNNRRRSVLRWVWLPLILVVTSGFGGHLWWQSRRASQTLSLSQQDLLAGRFQQAYDRAQRVLDYDPESIPALMTAGQAAAELDHIDQALAFYERVPQNGTRDAIVALGAAGDLLFADGHVSAAEQKFRAVLEAHPDHVAAHRRLSTILITEARRWESAEHLLALVKLQQFSLKDLLFLANMDSVYDNPQAIAEYLAAVPEDPLPLIGTARVHLFKEELEPAKQLLRRVLQQRPNQVDAQAYLGTILASEGVEREFLNWHQNLPTVAEKHPDIWVARGRWARRQGQPDVAIRCFWESLIRNPNHRAGNYQLAQVLAPQGAEVAAPFFERAEQLDRLLQTIGPMYFEPAQQPLMAQAATTFESLGRLWEAWAWWHAIAFHFPQSPNAAVQRDRLRQRIQRDMPQTLADANPARDFNGGEYPLPDWSATDSATRTSPSLAGGSTVIRFADQAQDSGLIFEYDNGDDRGEPGMLIYQSAGGGTASLDFDQDGWPDLYLSQGHKGIADSAPAEELRPANALFRNLGNGRFQDVSQPSRTDDRSYGQGVTVGDYNADGFPDLYLANIGANRLLRNNGDGTFTDVTSSCGLDQQLWTTSCLLVDLNHDAFPDIVDVNYCAGQEPLKQTCGNADTKMQRTCRPLKFRPENDAVYLSNGDGTFRQTAAFRGTQGRAGRGMGIVAADFTGSGRIDLFIANDMSANFYLENRLTESQPALLERGGLAGCAFDEFGRAQACMGMAVDDIDGNGQLDVFVTNFYNEFCTLYLQDSPGLFVDRSRPAGLADASLAVLGFGTQCLDADLDGWPEIVIANGHIDDFSHEGIPFAMRPQLFRNLGQGRFAEQPPRSLGPYFERQLLGRSLATLDWNRDGLRDFAVSHINAPAALLTNRTAHAGHYLALSLRGTTGDREAIGTTVRAHVGQRQITAQLSAGDGYQSSNQRILIIGLGEQTTVQALDVHWTSGLKQRFVNLTGDRRLLLTEGQPTPLELPYN